MVLLGECLLPQATLQLPLLHEWTRYMPCTTLLHMGFPSSPLQGRSAVTSHHPAPA